MTAFETHIRTIRKRLVLLSAASSAIRLLFYLAIAAAILILARRFFYVGTTPLAIAGVVAAAACVAWVIRKRQPVTMLLAAERADGAFALQERLSSALAMMGSGERMLPALIDDASRHAGQVDPSRFRFRPTRHLLLLPAPIAVALAGLLFVPQMDALGLLRTQKQREEERKEVRKRGEHLSVKTQELARRIGKADLPEARKLALEMQKLADEMRQTPAPKQEAMLRMSKLSEEARKLQEQGQGKRFEGMKSEVSQKLDKKIGELDKTAKAMRDLRDALQKGDLDKAAAAMKNIGDQMKEGKVSDGELQKLGEALAEMAKDMPANDQLTKSLAEMAQKLGAKDAEALAQALQQMQLTAEQMQELQKLMQQAQAADFAKDLLDYEKACLACSGSGKKTRLCICGNPPCAGCGTFNCVCCPTPVGPDGGPCCRCTFKAGAGAGGGMANTFGPKGGKGSGERTMSPPGPVDFKDTRVPQDLAPGKILATQFLKGMPPEGADAKLEYQNVLKSARKVAEDAMRSEDIPPEYRDRIKCYFEDLEKK